MSLSEKSNEELSSLLTEYGIKHGPVVESTRKLYEKKLEKAMQQAPVKTSPDKTYYREEEEEVTYITYHHSAAKHERAANMVKRQVNTEPDEADKPDPNLDTHRPYEFTYRTTNHSAIQSRKPIGKKSGGSLRNVIPALLLLAVLAAVGYFAYTSLSGIQ